MKLISITLKYKYLECLSIIKNESEYSVSAIEKAKKIVEEYRSKKTIQEFPPITEQQRQEIKNKYPKTY